MKNMFFALWTKYYELAFGYCANRSSEQQSRIYMFHSVSEAQTDPKNFISNHHGFEQFIVAETVKRSPAALATLIDDRRSGCFAVSFDDVYENVYTYAYPVLKKHNVPFTLFVTTDFLDQDGYLTTRQLQEMAADPLCTVGAHTKSHPRLRTAADAQAQIRESGSILQQLLGKPIDLFAYPYGSIWGCSRKNAMQAKCAGYRAAFSTMRGYLIPQAYRYRFFLPRLNGDHFVKTIEKGEA